MPVKKKPETRSRIDARTAEEFELAAILEAVESLADEVGASVAAAREQALEHALDIYYTAEELARDPEHAEHASLKEQVEKMRAAYERSYGHSIPTKAETEARRKRQKKG